MIEEGYNLIFWRLDLDAYLAPANANLKPNIGEEPNIGADTLLLA